jgi:coproporphyrinogen III oxidase-like Fe-S oxidoreductase
MSTDARFDEIFHYYQFITYLLAKEEFAYPSPNYGQFFTRGRVKRAWAETRAAIEDGRAPADLSLYLHLPFCECGCLYCMSGSIQVSRRGRYLDAYLDTLVDEMDCYTGSMGDVPVLSAYVGGGTPSLLDVAQIRRLLGALRARYALDGESRVIFEASPFTMSAAKIDALVDEGVHELALGVQSFDQAVLDANRRPQKVEQATRLIRRALDSPLPSTTVDVMIGLPQQSRQSALSSVAEAIELQVDGVMLNEFLPLSYIRYCREGGSYTTQQHLEKKAIVAEARTLLKRAGYRATVSGYRREWDRGDERRAYKTQEAANLLGFGFGAYSHAHGTLKYQLLYPFMDFAGYMDGASWMTGDSGISFESMFNDKLLAKYQTFTAQLDDDPFTYVGLELDPDREMHVYAYSHLYHLRLGAFQKRFGASFARVFRNPLLVLASQKIVGLRDDRLVFLSDEPVAKRTARTFFVDKPYIEEVLRINTETYDQDTDYASLIVGLSRSIS